MKDHNPNSLEWEDISYLSNIKEEEYSMLPPMVISKDSYIFGVSEKGNTENIRDLRFIMIVKLDEEIRKRYNSPEYIAAYIHKNLPNHLVEIINNKIVIGYVLKEFLAWSPALNMERQLKKKVHEVLDKLRR